MVLFVLSVVYLYGGTRLKMGTMKNPGPGFVPSLLGLLLFATTGLYLINALRGRGSNQGIPDDVPPPRGRYGVVFGILGAVLIYPVLLTHLQFVLSTFIVLFAMLVLLRYRSPLFSGVVALLLSVVSFVVFARLLGVGLPIGILEEMIFRVGR
jgi:putative tricarboxylic transport membrane protein